MTTCKLSALISPAFYDTHRAIKAATELEIVEQGGRGSCKSSYISIESVLLLLRHPEVHACVFRKVGNTLRNSVFAQYCWAVDVLGLSGQFRCTVSPMEITYKRTGQKIMFFGLDDPGKVKSIKVPFGYIGIAHFEELDQYSGPEEIRSAEQSIFRGGPLAICFKSFNPPSMARNWANRYALEAKPGKIVHSTTYQTTPREWLGEKFLADAEHLKQTNPTAYRHEYLGEVVGCGTQVFDNLLIRKITEEERKRFDRIYLGGDWGYYPDPWAFNRVHFDAARRTLYVLDELHMMRASNRQTADALLSSGVTGADIITMDSAEPKSIEDYRSFGLNARGAEKGPGSVSYSMKWLQGLHQIVIDPETCQHTVREFSEYEYERTKDGEIVNGYPDVNNHHIDAVRYAMNPVWRRRGL